MKVAYEEEGKKSRVITDVNGSAFGSSRKAIYKIYYHYDR